MHKFKIKVNSLTTEDDIHRMREIAASIVGVETLVAGLNTDYKNNFIDIQFFFPKSTDNDKVKEARDHLRSLIGVDRVVVFPIGGSPGEFENLVVDQEVAQLVLDSAPEALTFDLSSSIEGASPTCKFVGSDDGLSGKALKVTDNYTTANYSSPYGAGTNYTHRYESFVQLPAGTPRFAHVKMGWDMKIGAGDAGNFPAVGGTHKNTINLSAAPGDVAYIEIIGYDNNSGNGWLLIQSGGVQQYTSMPINLNDGYIRVDIEVLAGQFIKVKVGANAEVMVTAAPQFIDMASMTVQWQKIDVFTDDAAAKTQKPFLLDNMSIELLS